MDSIKIVSERMGKQSYLYVGVISFFAIAIGWLTYKRELKFPGNIVKPKGKIKIIILSSFSILVLLLIVGTYYFLIKNKQQEISHPPCLASNEDVQYQAYENENGPSNAKIFIKNKDINEAIFEFKIENIVPNHYHPYEIHKCGIYLVREFNYDYKKGKPLPNFRMEVWRYHYDGSGEKLVEENDFRVDFTETYIALEQSYLGQTDYALVIKDLKTKEDVFVLTLDELIKKYSVIPASIGLGKWRDNGRYFWAVLFIGPRINAYIRIDANTWKVDVLPTPDDYTGGILSSPTGEYIVYDNSPGFIGIDIVAQKIYEEWRKEGKEKILYLYNLFTKEKITLATIDDPAWNFKPKWLSDTEFEYELPTGEKKIYRIEK